MVLLSRRLWQGVGLTAFGTETLPEAWCTIRKIKREQALAAAEKLREQMNVQIDLLPEDIFIFVYSKARCIA